MNRRDVLAHAGAGGLVCIAGCLGSAETSDGPDDTAPDIDDHPCPPYETGRARSVCSHTVDTETAPVYLQPSTERGTLDDVTLTLHNESDTELTFNPSSWSVRYDSGTEWDPFRQELSVDGVLTVPPDATHSWSFRDVVESIREDPTFEPGSYAAEIGVPDPRTDGQWLACIALVRLDAGG